MERKLITSLQHFYSNISFEIFGPILRAGKRVELGVKGRGGGPGLDILGVCEHGHVA